MMEQVLEYKDVIKPFWSLICNISESFCFITFSLLNLMMHSKFYGYFQLCKTLIKYVLQFSK